MLSKDFKNIKITNIGLLLLIFALFSACFVFIFDSINLVSETNQNNFSYTIKIRDALEEIDKIVERAETNISVLSDTIKIAYDEKRLQDKNYNFIFLDRFNVLTKAALMNSPGVDGVWFQVNNKLPFAPVAYDWHGIKNGKITDIKALMMKEKSFSRELTPETDPYYFETVKNKKLTWSNIYKDSDINMDMVTIAQPVYKNGVLIGVVGIDITIGSLQNTLKNMQYIFPDSELFLLDANKKILLYQVAPKGKSFKNIDTFDKLFNENFKDEDMVEYSDNGIKKTALLLSLSNKYHIVITFPNRIIYKGFSRLFHTIYFIFIVLIALAIVGIISRLKINKINKQLHNETAKLRGIIDSSPNAILIKDLNGIYTDCNIKFLEMLHIEKKDLIGKTDYDLFTEAEIEEITRNDNIVKETKQTLVQETCYYNKIGEKFCIEKYVVPLFNYKNELSGLLIIAFDISKQQQEKELLQTAKETAEKTTAIKSNFLANMSHEIRTPLNGVLGFIQLLKDTSLTEEQEEYIDDAQKSSETLLNIINDILDFSKIEADKLQIDNVSFDIRSLVEDVTLMATVNAERKGLDVNSLICSDVPQRIFGDPGRIKQIFNNLLSNAIKFTTEGEIVIYVKQISENKDNCVLSFEVKDTGIGVSEDKLNLIFEEFTQADASTTRKFGGTGLGLAISQKLVDLMGGYFEVKSKLGEGSSFTFTLPFQKDKDSNPEDYAYIKELNGTKILILDQNITDLKIIHYYLGEVNCIIYEAKSVEEAFNIIKSEDSNISVIIADYKTQDLNNLIKNKKTIKNIPVILYTSLAQRGDSLLAKEQGFNGYLTKPIKKKELIETILMVINSKETKIKEKFVTKHLVKEKEFNMKAKILIVEDSEINCKLILKILTNQGLSPDLALNGQEAVDAVKSKKYDLILMDCQMPILDGYEATRQIREYEDPTKHTPIVAMTANALAKDEEKCREAGMDDYISKPVNIENLLNIISKYIKQDIKPEIQKQEELEEANEIENIVNQMASELALKQSEAIHFFIEYLEFLPKAIAELNESYNENDFETMKKVAHKIKGSSANLRIEGITQLSRDLEEAINENKGKEYYLNTINKIKDYLDYLNILLSKLTNK